MKSLLLILLFLSIHQNLLACTPVSKKTNPPRLINGVWVQPTVPDQQALLKADYDSLMARNYAFVFSAVYHKEVSFSNKQLSFLKTQKVWHGKVPKSIDLDSTSLPGPHDCKPMEFGEEYLLFGILGNRKNPIILKAFRLVTPALLDHLGKPQKRWLRGRLIQVK